MKVASVFQDHMVLQRDREVPVWGWAAAGAKIRAAMAGAKAETVAGADGRWLLRLPPLSAGGPHRLKVSGEGAAVEFNDVLVGEVWVCSGQSNMEWSVALASNAAAEIAAAVHPGIRMLNVVKTAKMAGPAESVEAQWLVCNPDTVGAWSAVGYYFARELHRRLGVPVGMLNSSFGGTAAEAWISREGLQTEPFWRPLVERLDLHLGPAGAAAREADRQRFAAWQAKIPGDPGNQGWVKGWAKPESPAAEWQPMLLPQAWQYAGLDFSGVLWFRREVTIPAAWAGRDLLLNLGACDKGDTTYFNNAQVGALSMADRPDAWSTYRTYPVPGRLVRAGRNLIAVRVFSNIHAGGMTGPAEVMWLAPAGTPSADRIPLSGDWEFRVEHNFGRISTDNPVVMGEDNPNTPTVLYNGMIAPLVPYGIKGAIWYQGESNAVRAGEYHCLMSALIRDWRRVWGGEEFPFHLVQLANYMPERELPEESEWAQLREAQRLTARRVPATGMAVAIDLGETADIHPRNKQEVGRRLALLALAQDYGLPVKARGPEPRLARPDGSGAALLRFDHCGTGLVATDAKLPGFALAGADRIFHWAQAIIVDLDAVRLTCPKVPDPRWIRYAWADNPRTGLVNADGLPAGPCELPLPSGPWRE